MELVRGSTIPGLLGGLHPASHDRAFPHPLGPTSGTRRHPLYTHPLGGNSPSTCHPGLRGRPLTGTGRTQGPSWHLCALPPPLHAGSRSPTSPCAATSSPSRLRKIVGLHRGVTGRARHYSRGVPGRPGAARTRAARVAATEVFWGHSLHATAPFPGFWPRRRAPRAPGGGALPEPGLRQLRGRDSRAGRWRRSPPGGAHTPWLPPAPLRGGWRPPAAGELRGGNQQVVSLLRSAHTEFKMLAESSSERRYLKK